MDARSAGHHTMAATTFDRVLTAQPRASGRILQRPSEFVYAIVDRPVNELFLVWLGMVVACALAYWALHVLPGGALEANGVALPRNIRSLAVALYFSAVTATSVGYGDVVPVGAARLVAIVESIAGLILFGMVISKFVSRRQEQVIGEIHRIAFEERLDRVRTNLHLVRTELQVAAQMCEGQASAPPPAVNRLESIATVFAGELHAVHDLLFRPQSAPDEAALEVILASLTSVFRDFAVLLECVDAGRPVRSSILDRTVRTIARLAREICGDCVPREYAQELRTWMDQIQATALQIVDAPRRQRSTDGIQI